MFETKTQKDRKELILCYKRLFSTEDGKRVMEDLMRSTPMLYTSFEQDQYKTAFNEGARSVVLRILRTTQTTEQKLEQLMEKMEEQYEL